MQIVYIDLIPQKEKPIVNLSQYDNDRLVRFMLLENGEEYTLTGTETIDVNIRKPDGNIVVITPKVTANHYVDVLFTEQSAACYGMSVGELSIKENSTIIGTCNFIMEVEKSPTCGGIQSATEIENLQSQIDDIISGEGYLKAEDVAQVALSGDYNDLTNKPDMLDYYTKSQTDALLNNKVDNSTLGSYYTKSQTEALIDDRLLAIMPVETATGNPCSFDTDIAAELHGLTAEIVASGGGGTPQVPNPIVGHSELNLVRCGKNLFDKTATDTNNGYYPNAWLNGADVIVPDSDTNISEYIQVPANTNFYIKGTTYGNLSICFYDINKTFISGINYNYRTEFAFTTPPNTAYLRFSIIKANIDITQLELGSTATAYEPYHGTPYLVQFGQTVYGGELDVKNGKLRIAHQIVDLGDLGYGRATSYDNPIFYANLSATYKGFANSICSCYNKISDGSASSFAYNASNYDFGYNNNGYGQLFIRNDDYSDPNAFQTAMEGQKVTLELATPIEIDVSELSVDTIVGTNNITSDCNGDVTASYKVSTQKYIDDRT